MERRGRNPPLGFSIMDLSHLQQSMYKAADASLQWLNTVAAEPARRRAKTELTRLKSALALVRGEGDHTSVLWNPTTKKGAESIAVVNPTLLGVHGQVGQLDQSGCYLRWFQSMGDVFPELARLAKDPHAVLREHCSLGDDVFTKLSTKTGAKIWYCLMYGKMEKWPLLRVFSCLLRVRNAVYVGLVIKWVLKENPHLTFVASASDSITFKGFEDHAEFRRLSHTLSSTVVRTDELRNGVLCPCDKAHGQAFSMQWKRELPHESADSGLAVGIFSGKCNLYLLTNPEDLNSETSTKVVPKHMFLSNLDRATNPVAAQGTGVENQKIDPHELFERMKQAATIEDPARAHAALLRILNECFRRKRKSSYQCTTIRGKSVSTTPWACQLLMNATKSSSLSSGSLSRRDPAIARQGEIGGFVVQKWHNDGGKEYVVVQDLRDCLNGCYHPLFVGRGVYIRAVVDYDLPVPLKKEWLIHLANALRRFWSANGQEVIVEYCASTTMRNDPKKAHSSHVVFRCVRAEDGVECVFACVEDILQRVFQTYLDDVSFDFPKHNPMGRLVGNGPWAFADAFDTKIYRTGASLRSAGSRSAGETGLFGAHVPLFAAQQMNGASPAEGVRKYWNPTAKEFDCWSFLVRGPAEQFVVHGEPREITAAASCGGLLLPSEITGQRILQEYVKLFYPGWPCKFVPGVQYYPSAALPCMRSTVICRCCVNAAQQPNRNLNFHQLFSKILLPRVVALENGKAPPSLEKARKTAGALHRHTNNSFITLYYDCARKTFSEARGDVKKAEYDDEEHKTKRKHHAITRRHFFKRNSAEDGSVDVLGGDLELLLGEIPAETRDILRADLEAQVRIEEQCCIKVDNIELHKTDAKTLNVNVKDIRHAFMYRHALHGSIHGSIHGSRKSAAGAPKKKRRTNPTHLTDIQREILSHESRESLAIIVSFLMCYDHALAAKIIGEEKNMYQSLPRDPNSGVVLAYLEKKQQDISKTNPTPCPRAFAPALFLGRLS